MTGRARPTRVDDGSETSGGVRAAFRGGVLTAVASCLLLTLAVVGLIALSMDAQREALGHPIAALGWPVTPLVILVVAALAGLVIGMLVGLYFGVLGGLWYGGADAIQHGVLRWLLWRRGEIPWRIGRFLDAGTRLIFLQRVGGGYRFVHGALMAYLAARDGPQPP